METYHKVSGSIMLGVAAEGPEAAQQALEMMAEQIQNLAPGHIVINISLEDIIVQ